MIAVMQVKTSKKTFDISASNIKDFWINFRTGLYQQLGNGDVSALVI